MEKKEFIAKLEDLQNHLQNITARPEDVLEELRDTVEEFGLRNQYPDLWDNYKTSGEIEDMLRDALDSGLERVYYFVYDLELLHNLEVMYVDNYGNCDSKVGYKDLINVIEEILNGLES